MNKAFSNFTWYNEPDIRSPLAAALLNRINEGLNEVDNRVVTMDTSKANQSDLLQDIKTVSYNTTTGVWTFTHQNGTVDTVDQNVEKIPVSFSMSPQGIITMTTADGTEYTADVASLIKTYTFNDSSVIDFTTTTDASGNKIVIADIIDGSITAEKLQPNYLADVTNQANIATQQATAASSSATEADYNAKLAQSYAIGNSGVRQGEDTDNAKYYKEQAAGYVDDAETAAQTAEDAIETIAEMIGVVQFTVDFLTGELIYTQVGENYEFSINETTGNLEWEVVV